MKLIPVGAGAVLVEVGGPEEALALALWARPRIEAEEIVPAASTVLFDGLGARSDLRDALAEWRPGMGREERPLVEIPVVYDGSDLAAVAHTWGVPVSDVGRIHRAAEHVVAFCGFAPGFSYLSNTLSLPEVPRRSTPRERVAPGSVGLAGRYTGIYPSASPGGWQVIGRTEVCLWEQSRTEPALLPPGTRVRFVAG